MTLQYKLKIINSITYLLIIIKEKIGQLAGCPSDSSLVSFLFLSVMCIGTVLSHEMLVLHGLGCGVVTVGV